MANLVSGAFFPIPKQEKCPWNEVGGWFVWGEVLVLTDVFIVLITLAFLAYSKHFYIIFLGSI